MSMYEAGEIIDTATREIPEEIMDNPEVQDAIQYLFSHIEEMTDWIDPQSHIFEEHLDSAKHDGAVAVVEKYQEMLADALYRQRLFGTRFDLEEFIETLSVIPIDEVLHG